MAPPFWDFERTHHGRFLLPAKLDVARAQWGVRKLD